VSILNNTTEAGAVLAEESPMAEYKAGARQRPPTHPGKIIERAIAESENLSTRKAALAMGVTAQALANVIAGASAVSPEMALRLGAFFSNGAELWLAMQTDYDLWRARQAMKGEIAKIKPVSFFAR